MLSCAARGARFVLALPLLLLLSEIDAGSGRAALVPRERLPLRTEGRFIVDRLGERVKWACTNWYGPESISFAFGGLEKRPVGEIVHRLEQAHDLDQIESRHMRYAQEDNQDHRHREGHRLLHLRRNAGRQVVQVDFRKEEPQDRACHEGPG